MTRTLKTINKELLEELTKGSRHVENVSNGWRGLILATIDHSNKVVYMLEDEEQGQAIEKFLSPVISKDFDTVVIDRVYFDVNGKPVAWAVRRLAAIEENEELIHPLNFDEIKGKEFLYHVRLFELDGYEIKNAPFTFYEYCVYNLDIQKIEYTNSFLDAISLIMELENEYGVKFKLDNKKFTYNVMDGIYEENRYN